MANPGRIACPHCQGENSEEQAVCSHCGRALAREAPEAPPVRKAAGPSFQIGSLMLLIALIAVLIAAWRVAPGLAILLLIPSGVGLGRTIVKVREAGDRPMSLLEHAAVFLAAFSFSTLIFLASGVAFFLTCLGISSTGHGPYGGDMIGFGLAGGAIAGLAVCIWLFTKYFQAH
ncbi:MAG TPA: hypothetical protein VFT74_18510 [Isosphaeraceae bacterium]|nr:hypothetical protein [Isosphaeraceae bacterium]